MSVPNLKKMKLKIGIIGAGPAGAMAAYLLSNNGFSVTLIEKKNEVERKVCGEYLCPKGVELLTRLGLIEKLCKSFQDLNGMVLVSPSNIAIPSYFPKTSQGLGKGLSLNRKIFDQNLLILALENGATLLKNKHIKAITQSSNEKWLVSTDDESYEYDFVIAADGRQSRIGQLLGHIKPINTKRVAVHCYLPRNLSRGQRLGEMHILNGNKYCGLDPINDNEVNFSVVCDAKNAKGKSGKTIINETIKSSQRLQAMFDPIVDDSISIKIVTSLKNENKFIAGNKLAYVGDASGFIDPLTGEGIYNALLTSSLLVESLMDSEDLSSALAKYKTKKKALSFQKNILNTFFQFLIRKPFLVNMTANYLKKSQERANQFIGIIGNINSPLTGLLKMLKA